MSPHARGFSLVELLFALLILTLVITTTLAVFVTRTQRMRQASETILAYQVLSNEAEFQRRIAFADLANSNSFSSSTDLLAPLAPYKTKVAIDSTKVGIKTVTMTISWRAGNHFAQLAITRVDTGGSNLW